MWAFREATRAASETIEPEHLLLGLLIEDQGESGQEAVSHFGNKAVIHPPLGDPIQPFFSSETAGNLRRALAPPASPGAPQGDPVDLPLAETAQRALLTASEHAGNTDVQLLHILLALISGAQISDEKSSVRDLLKANGVTVEQVTQRLAGK